MSRRTVFQLLLAFVTITAILFFAGGLFAQGNRDVAFERAREAQERHTDALMARPGVVGTAVGLNDDGEYAVLVLLEIPGAPHIPEHLDGVPVRPVVTGKIYALPKPPTPPGQGKKNPPEPPTGLIATAVSSSQIDLTWTDEADNETGFKIKRDSVEIAKVGANVTNYSDTGLDPSTEYTYQVCAYNNAGDSTYSIEASATTPSGSGDVTPPAAPSNLVATTVGSSQIDLNWTDNTDNETGFKIKRDSSEIAEVGANVTSYSNTGLDPSTTYTYQVCAYNDAGDSTYSNEASATTDPAPEKPPLWCERPVPIGVSTGHPNITAGTIGCRVIDGAGTVYALSNNHVYADENKAHIGDNVLQPGTYDGGVDPDDAIGTLADFVTIVFGPRSRNTVDAAIAVSTVDLLGNATPFGGYGTPSSTTVEPEVGMEVHKHGRTTGLTEGGITGINATVRVRYDSGQARFLGQIVIGPGGFSDGGDSGSLIVTQEGNNPVGLLFAGSSSVTIANPIDEVLAAFGASIDGE